MRRRGEQLKRLPRAQPRHLRGNAHATLRQLLPGGCDRAPPARRPRPRCRRGRDIRYRHQHPQGAARRGEDGRVQALQGPGECNYAAMESESCRLTALGKQYWRLAYTGKF